MKRFLVAAVLSLGFAFSGAAWADPPACNTAQLRSCGDWTAYYETSSSCRFTKCNDGFTVGFNNLYTSQQQRFRACFYSDGTQCKETQNQTIYECGGC